MYFSPNLESGPVAVGFNHVLGVTKDGVPVMCNGTEAERQSEEALRHLHHTDSLTPALRPLSSEWTTTTPATTTTVVCGGGARTPPSPLPPPFPMLGKKWESTELARRYLAARKAVWLSTNPPDAPPSAIWDTPNTTTFTLLIKSNHQKNAESETETEDAGYEVPAVRHINGEASVPPAIGDLLVWGPSKDHPVGHVAVVVGVENNYNNNNAIAMNAEEEEVVGGVHVVEQDHGCVRWPRFQPYSRTLPLKRLGSTQSPPQQKELEEEDLHARWRLEAETGLLGWVSIPTVPLLDSAQTDIGDDFRLVIGHGRIFRRPLKPELSLPWTNPLVSPDEPEYYLRQSLLQPETNLAKETDVPTGMYYLDYNAWCRLRNGAHSLHALAMEATAKILSDPEATYLLEHYFGIPAALHDCVRRSFATTPALGGRFDFGYDGSSIKLMEYNCDSSGALLECCETQEKMAKHYGMEEGESTGSWLSSALVEYFRALWRNTAICPTHGLIHFFIDNDNEEQYTAMTVMRSAEEAGFRTKLCAMPHRYHFTPADEDLPPRSRAIYDEEEERVELVWKTWSWDTVLHQYEVEQATQGDVAQTSMPPTLSHILLNDHIVVLEPFWKAVTGSKAILPYMYHLAPDHELLLPCSFVLTNEIASEPYISKPVNGRAGQNISMFDPVTTPPPASSSKRSSSSSSAVSIASSVHPSDNEEEENEEDRSAENSPGRFYNSVVVYQQRLFLKKFSQKFFPIFCGWMIHDRFAGIVVREDQSKITTLDSLVAPARVIRDDMVFRELEQTYNTD